MIKLIKELKSKQSVIVCKIRCDNSGENVAFKNQAKEEGLGLIFEFMAHQTPQQNGCVQHKYATLFGQVQAMLNSASLSGKYENLCHGLWAKCSNMATKLANIAAPSGKDPPHFQFFKMTLSFVSHLCICGEIGVMNTAAPLCSKLANRGAHCMFIGYAKDHVGSTFKMLNLRTNRIWQS